MVSTFAQQTEISFWKSRNFNQSLLKHTSFFLSLSFPWLADSLFFQNCKWLCLVTCTYPFLKGLGSWDPNLLNSPPSFFWCLLQLHLFCRLTDLCPQSSYKKNFGRPHLYNNHKHFWIENVERYLKQICLNMPLRMLLVATAPWTQSLKRVASLDLASSSSSSAFRLVPPNPCTQWLPQGQWNSVCSSSQLHWGRSPSEP